MTKIGSHRSHSTSQTSSTPKTSTHKTSSKKNPAPATDRVAVQCNDPSMKAHVTEPKFGRGNVVLRGMASNSGIVPSSLSITLPPYGQWDGQKNVMEPAQTLTTSLSGGETPKEVAERLATRINKETAFQAEVKPAKGGGYELVISDKLRALGHPHS